MDMEAKVKALIDQNAQVSTLLNKHLVDCADNYASLKDEVGKVSAWVEPQILKAEAKARVWQKASETVQTDGMVFVIKAAIVITVVAIAYGIVPAGRALVEGLLKTFLGF